MTARFICPRCGKASSNPTDKEEGYCGACHAWTAKPQVNDDPGLPYPDPGRNWLKLIYGLFQAAAGLLIGATLIDGPRPERMGIAVAAVAILAAAVAYMVVTAPRDNRRMAANRAYIEARYGPATGPKEE